VPLEKGKGKKTVSRNIRTEVSVLSNGKLYEGNERPPYGQGDILLPKFRCEHCDKFFTDLDVHYEDGCEGISNLHREAVDGARSA
jgi:hypothetical protein